MKRTLMLSILIATISGCSSLKKNTDADTVKLTGRIEQIGMTTFQYGTHLIKAKNKTYALKSTQINLDDYVDKSITLKGAKVSGYPLEGGPQLIEVSEI